MGKNKTFLIKWLVFLGDAFLINAIFLILSSRQELTADPLLMEQRKEILLMINLCYLISLYFIPIKISERSLFIEDIIRRAALVVPLHLLLLSVCFFLFSYDVASYSFFVAFYLTFFVVFVMWRVAARLCLKAYRSSGHNYQRVVIVGAGKNGLELYDELMLQVYYGYRVIGVFDDNEDLKNSVPEYKGLVSEAEAFCLENDVDEIYCALPSSQDEKIIRLLNFAEKNMIRFYLLPEFYRYLKRKLTLKSVGHLPVVALRDEPLQYWHNRFFKRCFDVIFSFFVLVFIYPVMYAVLGVLIKLSSPGPVIFKQLRTGLYGKDFYCYKFRSMRLNDESDDKQAEQADPRTTKVGQLIRKTNLDEFPQFFNVLRGDMSVVGPRPHMLKHTRMYSELIDRYMVRHLVKPGITGLAQVTGCRGETKTVKQMEERVKRDVWYIENVSFLLDAKIIYYTILGMFGGDKNAY